MNTDKKNLRYPDPRYSSVEIDALKPVTEKIIGAAYCVSNTLGSGFLEKVYENALAHELQKLGLRVRQQDNLPVWYDGIKVGSYFADIVVNDCILIELKALDALAPEHQAQCINYLKATGLKLCLLINFGRPRIEIKRVVI